MDEQFHRDTKQQANVPPEQSDVSAAANKFQKKRVFVIAGIVVLIIAAGAIWYFIFVKNAHAPLLTTERYGTTTEQKKVSGADREGATGTGPLKLKESGGALLPPPDVSKWISYRNESCGFEVKFPPSYVEIGKQGDCDDIYSSLGRQLSVANLPACRFPFRDIPGCQLHYITVAGNKIIFEGAEIKKEKAMFGGLVGEKLTAIGEPEPTVGTIDIQAKQKPGVWYRYHFAFNLKDRKLAEETFNKVVSTFKITKELESGYKLFDGGTFTFEYPKDWIIKSTQKGVRKTDTFFDGTDVALIVNASPNQGGITLEDWWSEMSKNSRWVKVESGSISGSTHDITAYKLILPETDAGNSYIFITGEPREPGSSVMYDIYISPLLDKDTVVNRLFFTMEPK